jgi:hypothetical protein
MSFCTSTPVLKSRKRTRCDHCAETIDVGMPAVSVSGVWEGDFFSGRYHCECWRALFIDWPSGEFPGYGECDRGSISERGVHDCRLHRVDPVSKEEARYPKYFNKEAPANALS